MYSSKLFTGLAAAACLLLLVLVAMQLMEMKDYDILPFMSR